MADGAPKPYDSGLDRRPANHVSLTPISFLARAAHVHPMRIACIHGAARTTYAELYNRARRLASALAARGIGLGDTVSVMAPNVPALLEAHYAVPMTGAVLNAINTRLDSATVAHILDHGEAKLLITDREYSETMAKALETAETRPFVVDIDDPEYSGDGAALGDVEYEDFIAAGDPDFAWAPPGTNGRPYPSTTRRALRATLRAWSIITGGLI